VQFTSEVELEVITCTSFSEALFFWAGSSLSAMGLGGVLGGMRE